MSRAPVTSSWNVLDPEGDVYEVVRSIGIVLPRITGDVCVAKTAPAGMTGGRLGCTRTKGHGGRHAATLSDRSVVAVWGEGQ